MLKSLMNIAFGLFCLVVLVGATGCTGQPLTTREKGTLMGAGWALLPVP